MRALSQEVFEVYRREYAFRRSLEKLYILSRINLGLKALSRVKIVVLQWRLVEVLKGQDNDSSKK